MAPRISLSWAVLAVFVAVGLVALVATDVVSLNVDEADAALDETGAPSFTQEDANAFGEMDEDHAEDEMDDEFDGGDEESDSDATLQGEDMSFLEDGGHDDMEDDFDFNNMDEEQVAELANSLEGEEREAFLAMWDEHKAGAGSGDGSSAFAEL
ncbi:hypothetical protein BESB_013840 [Besnoitia besnoiti]|uniref:Transmembrane protein n=1 Tax=Besnoitia besnoiti TaxID=94643 RepID=A0A2A9MBK5_BESBE|nr:hypothetical protein BESB_013840 [Besnoitia besnoiti]PFH32772.1 hypothetical protein BESB_013840 [Besnoitia besnoiti]